MTTRADVVAIALAENGYHDGEGYDEVNKYAQAFSIGYGVAYCDIFVAWCYSKAGLPLPKMGSWIVSGSQYVPDSYNFYAERGALRAISSDAQPGDQVLFSWDGNMGPNTHTELVETWHNGVLYTVGGNSGPSNVDGFTGVGGVHRHAWTCPAGVGNPLIYGVGDPSAFVTFSTDEELTMDAEAKTAFADLRNSLEVVFEGGLPSDKNPYGIVGLRDLGTAQKADHALLVQIAQHLGLKVAA